VYKRKTAVKFFVTEGEKVTCIHEYLLCWNQRGRMSGQTV